jgi:hypothetical protein
MLILFFFLALVNTRAHDVEGNRRKLSDHEHPDIEPHDVCVEHTFPASDAPASHDYV